MAIVATFATTTIAFAQTDSTEVAPPVIYIGVNAGAEFADPETDETEFQLTGALAYQFPLGLFIEYEGGAQGGEYAGWTRVGWALYKGDPICVVTGVDNVYNGTTAYGAFASLFFEIFEGRAVRGTVEGNYDVDLEEFTAGTKVGFYLVN